MCWEPVPAPGRTLFVVFAYHGRDGDDAPSVWRRFESSSVRGHRIVHRDHYANPRDLGYQLALVAQAAARLSPSVPPDLVLDAHLEVPQEPAGATAFDRVERADVARQAAWDHGVLADARKYDHVVLVYPDALGLGCTGAERAVLAAHESTFVITGRRRAFRLTPGMRRRLQFSRWLAHTRIAERAFAIAVRPIAAVLASLDRVAGRT